jgi:hypothetical protein
VKTPRTTTDAVPAAADDDDDYSGDTKAHYMPNEPRPPAGTVPPRVGEVDEIAEIGALFAQTNPLAVEEEEIAPLPREPIVNRAATAPSAAAPQLLQLPQLPIPEMFQAMLWRAFRAGALLGEPTYEAFARWYEREVLG